VVKENKEKQKIVVLFDPTNKRAWLWWTIGVYNKNSSTLYLGNFIIYLKLLLSLSQGQLVIFEGFIEFTLHLEIKMVHSNHCQLTDLI
jgi:hypothetical protein